MDAYKATFDDSAMNESEQQALELEVRQDFEAECKLAAQLQHQHIQGLLDQGLTPWWRIMDLYEALGDEVANFYTSEMRKADENHPNYFSGSTHEWDENDYDD